MKVKSPFEDEKDPEDTEAEPKDGSEDDTDVDDRLGLVTYLRASSSHSHSFFSSSENYWIFHVLLQHSQLPTHLVESFAPIGSENLVQNLLVCTSTHIENHWKCKVYVLD